MGLDMYLYAEKYESCGSWHNNYEKKKKNFYPKKLESFQNNIDQRNFLSKEVFYQIGYWRKANALHKWFVDNCAEGEDDCRKVYVSKEQLESLLSLCEEILKDHSKANELLPTQSGFFFGGLEYDEWYFQDLKYTRDLIKSILDANILKEYEIYYQASW